ncbi:MAG: nucleotidyltransferase [Eubacterium sp.]|nr:nucleotidyltransferase [Eubacterium sp.]
MNIVIPMAGAGKRFADAGYPLSKPLIPTIDRRTGKEKPMVVCAALDLPGVRGDGSNLILIDRDFHKDAGVEEEIRKTFGNAKFITLDHLTEGQACTCLLAEEYMTGETELLIAGCDNGMVFDEKKFESEKVDADCLVFTYRHDESVLQNPEAYGWMKVDDNQVITDVSIKKPISDCPLEDHAVVATFWFRNGKIFVDAAREMIGQNDRVNNEFYVDTVIKYVLSIGYRAKVFEIERYLGWGTPYDYENYMNTIRYWQGFLQDERCLIEK